MLNPVDANFKMQMRSGGPPRGPDQPNGLPLRDVLTPLNHYLAQVCIDCFGIVTVFDEDHVSVAVLCTSKLHHAVSDGARWRTGTSRKVSTQVRSPFCRIG